jgi:putative ABC transport system permease protein
MARVVWLADVGQDVRVSVRALLRSPVLAATILLTVGVGIGATTVIYAAVDAALLRPLPYKEPARLKWIYTDAPPFMFRFSLVDYQAFQQQQTQFERIAAFTDRSMSFSDGASAELLRGRAVSWTYFGTLGITPALGRDFAEGDGRPGVPAVIVTQGFWRQRLGGRVDAIGTTIKLDGADHTVVGVLPPQLGPLERRQEFFIALQFGTPSRRGPFPYWVIGRLGPGTTDAAAASELKAINRRIFPLWRSSYQDDKATWSLMDLKERLVGNVTTTAGLALAAVALVWLIACTNASNLLIARVTSRQRELSVRAALGASRGRVLRHLLVESALLAGGAAIVGMLFAYTGIQLLRDVPSTYFPRTQEITLDSPVLIVLLGLMITSALMFGAIPAVQGIGARGREALHVNERSSSGTPSSRRIRRLLVGSQYAIATPLLVAAALLAGSLNELRQVDLGFDASTIVSGSVRLPAALYREGAVSTYWAELKRRAESLPGVSGVAYADSRPPNNAGNINNFDLEQFPAGPGQSQPVTPFVAVTPDYFRVFGLTLLEGRTLDEQDALPQNLGSVVVDRAWARRFFPNESAVGKRFRSGGCTQCPWTSVVGVVSDVKFNGLDQPNRGTVYTPLPPLPQSLERFVVLRTGGDPTALLGPLRETVRALDPNVPLTDVATMGELVDQSLQTPRVLSLLVGGFAVVALMLSVIGIYGVMAYYVEQHAKDISIRLALGGSTSAVLRMIVAQGMLVVVGGVVIGLLAAAASTRLMSTLLFGVSAHDLMAYASVSALLVFIALLACLLPARRAIGLEPAAVLRQE